MKGRKRQKASRPTASGEWVQLDDEPGEPDVLHPGTADRDHLAGEEEAVVAVAAEAREGARVERQQRRRHRSLPSGSIAASIAASSSSSSPRRCSSSQVVRRARTRRSSRSPSSVSVRPTRRRSSASRARSISPAFSSRSTWPESAGAEIRSSAASCAQAQPGIDPDQPEQRRLTARQAELLRLLAQLAAQPQQHRPQSIRDREWISNNLVNH